MGREADSVSGDAVVAAIGESIGESIEETIGEAIGEAIAKSFIFILFTAAKH
ncbi:MAG: hypothetical protein P8P12_01195 [Porticoccaceae bacterium]|nr:hypothetical protein [Porticoccaceae bacterium]